MANEDIIQILVQAQESGFGKVAASADSLRKQLEKLNSVNVATVVSTGKLTNTVPQQIMLMNQLGGVYENTANQLTKLSHSNAMFSKVFVGNSRTNLQELEKQGHSYSNIRKQLGQDLKYVQVASEKTASGFRNLTSPEKFKIMGHVFAEHANAMVQKMINVGKQMQWIGRQMIQGLTLPIVLGGQAAVRSFLLLNTQVTELRKFLIQAGYAGTQLTNVVNTELLPAFEDISSETALYVDQVTAIGTAWVAAGESSISGITELTRLTAQLNLLSQGEIDQEGAQELVRSVKATFFSGLDTADAIEETTNTIQQLSLIGAQTSLTMQEIATSLPIASTSAQNFGLTAGELAAVLAGMRNQGVQASEAANALKFSLNRLVNPTDEARESFSKLTKELTDKSLVQFFFDEDGMARGIDGLIEFSKVVVQVGEESQKAQAQLVGKLFGARQTDRMLKAILEMADGESQFAKALKDGTDDVKAYAAWTAQLNEVQESSAYKFKSMKVELAALAAKIGELIFPIVEKLGQKILDLLHAFEEAPDSTKHFVVALGAVAAALGPVVYGIAILTESLGVLAKFAAVLPLEKLFKVSSSIVGLENLGSGKLAGILGGGSIGSSAISSGLLEGGISSLLQNRADETENLAYLMNQLFDSRKQVVDDMLTDLINSGQLKQASTGAISGLPGLGGAWKTKEEAAKILGLDTLAEGMEYGLEEAIEEADINVGKINTALESKIKPVLDDGMKKVDVDAPALTFWQRVKDSLFAKKNLAAVTTPVGGRGGFGAVSLALGSPVKVLLGFLAAVGLVKAAPDIAKGFQQTDVAGTFNNLVKDLVNALGDLFGFSEDAKTTAEAFQNLGKMLGEVAKTIITLAGVLVPLVKVLAWVANIGANVIAQFLKPLSFEGNVAIQILYKMLAVITALVVGFKVFTLLQSGVLILVNTIRLLGATFTLASGQAAAAAGIFRAMLAAMTPGMWLAIAGAIIAVVTAISVLSRSTDAVKEAIDENIGQVTDSFDNLAKTAMETDKSVALSVDGIIESLTTLGGETFNALGFTVESFFNDIPQSVKAALVEEADEVKGTSKYSGITANSITSEYNQQKKINELLKARGQLSDALISASTELIGLSKRELVEIQNQVRTEIENVKTILASGDADEARTKELKEQLATLELFLNILPSTEAWSQAINAGKDKLIEEYRDLAAAARGVMTEGGKEAAREWSKAFKDALTGQLEQLSSRVIDQVSDALSDSQEAASEALDKAQERRVEAFEAASEKRLKQLDKEANAQIRAIDKQIKAIEKQNEREEWLRQQREWRQRREELMLSGAIGAAIAYRERLKAINEGRFDDARLITLQQMQAEEENANELRDIDREQRDAKEQRQDEKRIRALEKQRKAIEKHFERERKLLERQIENQRKALDEQLELQREALEEQQELQRERMEAMFEELREFMPKNKKEWDDYFEDIKGIANKFGVDVKDINRRFLAIYGKDISGGLKEAINDAEKIATKEAGELGANTSKAFGKGTREAIDPAASKLYSVMADYLEASKGDLKGNDYINWMRRIESALKDVKKGSPAYRAAQGLGGGRFHEGGKVGGNPKSDVPAVLQEGEYVIKRDTVKKVGVNTLNQLNDYHGGGLIRKFHTGGFAGSKYSQFASAAGMAPFPAIGTALGSIGSAIGGALNGMAIGIGRGMARGFLQAAGAGAPGTGIIPPGLKAPNMSVGAWPYGGISFGGTQVSGDAMAQLASRGGTQSSRNYIAALKSVFPNWFKTLVYDDYSRRGYNGADGPPWSQHSWGNAVDHNAYPLNPAANDIVAFWAKNNAAKLKLRTFIWRAPNHNVNDNMHMHADFWPAASDMSTPPVLHKGGFVKFDAPAMLGKGEVVLDAMRAKKLANDIEGGGAGGVTVNLNVDGPLIADDKSMRELYVTLERAGRTIEKRRGNETSHFSRN